MASLLIQMLSTMRRFLFLIPLFILASSSLAQPSFPVPTKDSLGRESLFDAMSAHPDSILHLRLTTDLGGLIRNRTKETYQKASISYTNRDGDTISRNLEVKARGNIRKEICSYPPIKMKWKRKTLDSLGYSRHNEMKVVWQCREGKHYEQVLLREFMAYRLYNLISPYSFRVQLAKMEVHDALHPQRHYSKYAFLIEDESQFEERTQGKFRDTLLKSQRELLREDLLRLYVFQYMIGNTDWSLGNLHNVHILHFPNLDKSVVVPYDFDYAGMVGANYAVPHESLPIKDIRERYYKGGECSEQEIQRLTQFFLEKKQPALSYCEQFPYLDGLIKKDLVAYIESFFLLLEEKKGLHQVIRTKSN
jgi:hypothetical protein